MNPIVEELLGLTEQYTVLITSFAIAKRMEREQEEKLNRVSVRIEALVLWDSEREFPNEASRKLALEIIRQGQLDLLAGKTFIQGREDYLARLSDDYRLQHENLLLHRALFVDPIGAQVRATEEKIGALRAVVIMLSNEMLTQL